MQRSRTKAGVAGAVWYLFQLGWAYVVALGILLLESCNPLRQFAVLLGYRCVNGRHFVVHV